MKLRYPDGGGQYLRPDFPVRDEYLCPTCGMTYTRPSVSGGWVPETPGQPPVGNGEYKVPPKST